MHLDILRIRKEILKESQARFGERFGVDPATIHRWETKGLPKHGAARHAVEKFVEGLEAAQ